MSARPRRQPPQAWIGLCHIVRGSAGPTETEFLDGGAIGAYMLTLALCTSPTAYRELVVAWFDARGAAVVGIEDVHPLTEADLAREDPHEAQALRDFAGHLGQDGPVEAALGFTYDKASA
ncbi:hypothetical protein ACQ5SO_19690 [Rhodovulum sp. DZ06]|uniref:hypothetical protein n=1 Tax=Rhodovulum sp. DZ06 TaxID=3425126 RepID=UPI003D35650A